MLQQLCKDYLLRRCFQAYLAIWQLRNPGQKHPRPSFLRNDTALLFGGPVASIAPCRPHSAIVRSATGSGAFVPHFVSHGVTFSALKWTSLVMILYSFRHSVTSMGSRRGAVRLCCCRCCYRYRCRYRYWYWCWYWCTCYKQPPA